MVLVTFLEYERTFLTTDFTIFYVYSSHLIGFLFILKSIMEVYYITRKLSI